MLSPEQKYRYDIDLDVQMYRAKITAEHPYAIKQLQKDIIDAGVFFDRDKAKALLEKYEALVAEMDTYPCFDKQYLKQVIDTEMRNRCKH